ncbi:MAG TPA: DUF4386 family protein [Candidatus Dormibacteraeota bacterium]|jgi:hypothetical protein|nr:DUF4386 family protein [Candidatus Dormibacteraeota bacterium]
MTTMGASIARRAAGTAASMLQIVGGWAALLVGAIMVAEVIVFIAVLPGLGFQTSYFTDPPKFVTFVTQEQGLYLSVGLLMLLASFAVVVVVTALHERLEHADRSLSRMALAFGYAGAVLLILNAFFQWAEFRHILADPRAFAEQSVPFGAVMFDLTNISASLALALWIALVSWSAIRAGFLPRAVAYLGLLAALALATQLIGVQVGSVIEAAWFLAIGAVLVVARSPAPEAQR